KGRCNLTNNVEIPDFLNNVVNNPKFLYGAISYLSPADVIRFFEENECRLKTERGNRVFPESDKASDITGTLQNVLTKSGVKIFLNTAATGIETQNGKVCGVRTENGVIPCDSVIVCTGGLSYPRTGSTGDGYRFAKSLGHSITDLKPSLVGLELKGNDFINLQGLSLKNVSVSFLSGDKVLYSDFGEMLFTHFGVSGPTVLSASCILNRSNAHDIILKIDLKPALSEKVLNDRLIREFEAGKTKSLSNVIRLIIPHALGETVLYRAGINGDKRCCEVSKVERGSLIYALKNLEFKVKGLRPIEEAIITAGGVSVKEINPKTMESKIVKGLFFAGEVLDIDAFTGGFNIQIAFSTGYAAGKNA
ncbi:MAG: NAD(P)/FAD-dependent oxidoreductase, partial [Clostridia bacterium]|nr:NAD(P)/FAD-dependent oxidoreductase [Clostridia bacterium]